MTLIKHKPWSQFFADPAFTDFSEFPSIFERKGDEMFPAINIIENEKNFEVEMAVPGFKKEDFKVDIDKSRLIISAETKKEIEKEEKNYKRREFSYNSFKRAFALPENVDEDSVDAVYKDGVLHLKVSKKKLEEKVTTRQINVK